MSRATLAIAVLALMAAGYLLVLKPLSESRAELRDSIEASYAALRKNEVFIERTRKTGVKLDDLQRELAIMEAHVIRSHDASVAFAQLQGRIQELARTSGIEVTSIKPLPASEAKGYRRLPIYMEGHGNMLGLSSFLRQLDATPDFISVDTIDVFNMTQDRLRIKIQFSGLMKT
ncbi:MAG: hypothetical protein Kow0025_16730 [Thermodesulfovibrionales bacterium]